MRRRRFLRGFLALPVLLFGVARSAAQRVAQPSRQSMPFGKLAPAGLKISGPVVSNADGQVIANLDIVAALGDAVTVLHRDVTVRNCRIRHDGGHGVHAAGASGLVLRNIEVERSGAPAAGPSPTLHSNNVNLENCPGAIITCVKASRGSTNVYVEGSESVRLSFLELHDARGPEPRGQNVQFNHSPQSILEDFTCENGPSSWTEDNVSVFRSDHCVVRRGLVSYNNSPTGVGVMLEGSFDCLVEDVDAVAQGNGAFAAVPVDNFGSGGCIFRRCRTRDSYNEVRDGRAAPTSNGLSIYVLISEGARKHTISECCHDALANPRNLIWKQSAVNPDASFANRAFTPRNPLRLDFGWLDS